MYSFVDLAVLGKPEALEKFLVRSSCSCHQACRDREMQESSCVDELLIFHRN
jgi:hypothetical protein